LERRAEWAEDDAAWAIWVAADAIDTANVLTLDAIAARMDVAPQLPDGATVINEGDDTYFQLDTVFFKQTDDGYEVIPAPDGSEVVGEDEA